MSVCVFSTVKPKLKAFQNAFAYDGNAAMKATKFVSLLNGSVQKLATINANLDERLHRNPV